MLSHEAQELVLYIENDGDLYRQQNQPILRNLANKAAQGKYDHQKAIKLWLYLMDNGAKKYAKEFGGTWNTMFPVAARKEAAKVFADDFEANWRAGEYRSYLTKVSAKKLGGGSSRPVPSGGGVAGRNRSGGSAEAMYIIKRYGKEVARVPDSKVLAWFHRHSSQSMDWALKYEGYSIHKVGDRNRSGSTKPKWGSDRDRYHGNPNARRNRAGHTRKTRDEYVLQVNYGYGHGWEDEVAENTLAAARERRKEYQANTSYPVRIRKKRVKLTT